MTRGKLITQCQRWMADKDYRRVVHALEGLPLEKRGKELTTILTEAWFYLMGDDEGDERDWQRVTKQLRAEMTQLYGEDGMDPSISFMLDDMEVMAGLSDDDEDDDDDDSDWDEDDEDEDDDDLDWDEDDEDEEDDDDDRFFFGFGDDDDDDDEDEEDEDDEDFPFEDDQLLDDFFDFLRKSMTDGDEDEDASDDSENVVEGTLASSGSKSAAAGAKKAPKGGAKSPEKNSKEVEDAGKKPQSKQKGARSKEEIREEAGLREALERMREVPVETRTIEECVSIAGMCFTLFEKGYEGEEEDLLDEAEKTLELVEKNGQNDDRWCHAKARLLRLRNKDSQALPLLEKAAKLKPGNRAYADDLESLRRYMTRPVFEKCYRQRVLEAWDAFLEVEKELYGLFRADPDSDDAFEQLWDILVAALDLPYLFVEFKDGKVHVYLRLDGDLTRVYEMDYFARHMPERCKGRWKFHVGLAQDLTGLPGDIRVWVDEVKEPRYWGPDAGQNRVVKVNVAGSTIDHKDPEAMEQYQEAICNALGEIPALWAVSEINIMPRGRKKPSIPLTQLDQTLHSMNVHPVEDAETYVNFFESLRVGGNGVHRPMEQGRYRSRAALDHFLQGKTEMVDRWSGAGIAEGFFTLPMGRSANHMAAAMMELQVGLSELAGPDAFFPLGWGFGEEKAWLDILAWDLDAVLKAADRLTGRPGCDQLTFQMCRKNVKEFKVAGISYRKS